MSSSPQGVFIDINGYRIARDERGKEYIVSQSIKKTPKKYTGGFTITLPQKNATRVEKLRHR